MKCTMAFKRLSLQKISKHLKGSGDRSGRKCEKEGTNWFVVDIQRIFNFTSFLFSLITVSKVREKIISQLHTIEKLLLF